MVIALVFGITLNAQNDNNELGSIVTQFRLEYNVPAIVVSVIKNDTILYGLSGLKRKGENRRVDNHSKFHLGSNTKAITSMIAAKLVEGGIIKLVVILPELKTQ